ncbi:hypothetical protein J2T57_001463 [Natronocella acetinitrilica]|uniref:Lipoprotein n=1 Tax=Natronocella acetinitrilica TaxID=414046 RepID=A0AAE3KB85_9GAMM|nr:hypothetical protein [Natronocella acetinitrilica]MCP1674361.1 hypothetical protein [Natronocella acetinitrilica]
MSARHRFKTLIGSAAAALLLAGCLDEGGGGGSGDGSSSFVDDILDVVDDVTESLPECRRAGTGTVTFYVSYRTSAVVQMNLDGVGPNFTNHVFPSPNPGPSCGSNALGAMTYADIPAQRHTYTARTQQLMNNINWEGSVRVRACECVRVELEGPN